MVLAETRDGCSLYLGEGVTLRPDDIESGFRWLQVWDAAVPLRPYTTLAQDCGDAEEREMTAALIRDLRQPVYDDRALFVRDNDDGRALLAALEDERCDHERCGLPFLRALWRVKPRLLALPAEWLNEGAV